MSNSIDDKIWRKGDPIDHRRLERSRTVLERVMAGKGITIRRIAGAMVISLTSGGRVNGIHDRIETVSSLPPIPEGGMREVFWTGDNQIWKVFAGQSKWTATQYTSSLSGVP